MSYEAKDVMSKDGAAGLNWALCIPTLGRPTSLRLALDCAARQTVRPSQIIIVDASDDWEANLASLSDLFPQFDAVEFIYLGSPIKSSAVQRNIALSHVTASIIFFFDDDSYMYPDCAEKVLAVYAADQGRRIAGLTGANAPFSPLSIQGVEQKISGTRKAGFRGVIHQSPIGRWIWREIFMMDATRLFVEYDAPRHLPADAGAIDPVLQGLRVIRFLPGFFLTVRSEVARSEPFDDNLLAYSPGEDLDATYRYGRHGLLVQTDTARLHHFEAAAARLKRQKVTALAVMNIAFFLRRNSSDLGAHRRKFFLMALRRVLAELLKDGLSRRWRFPQVAGTWYALRQASSIFALPDEELSEGYKAMQRRVLEWS